MTIPGPLILFRPEQAIALGCPECGEEFIGTDQIITEWRYTQHFATEHREEP